MAAFFAEQMCVAFAFLKKIVPFVKEYYMSHLSSWSRNMILHDTRLAGAPPPDYASNIYNFDGTVPTEHILGWAGVYAGNVGGLKNLFIMCHGYAGEDPFTGVCVDAGGSGIAMGLNGLTLNNVSLFNSLAGKVKRIIIYACAAADSSLGGHSVLYDGQLLMKSIALYSGATVIAGDRIQWYSGSKSIIDFGNWEGTVRAFDASGASMVLPNNFSPDDEI